MTKNIIKIKSGLFFPSDFGKMPKNTVIYIKAGLIMDLDKLTENNSRKIGRPKVIDDISRIIINKNSGLSSRKLSKLIQEETGKKIHYNTIIYYRRKYEPNRIVQ